MSSVGEGTTDVPGVCVLPVGARVSPRVLRFSVHNGNIFQIIDVRRNKLSVQGCLVVFVQIVPFCTLDYDCPTGKLLFHDILLSSPITILMVVSFLPPILSVMVPVLLISGIM